VADVAAALVFEEVLQKAAGRAGLAQADQGEGVGHLHVLAGRIEQEGALQVLGRLGMAAQAVHALAQGGQEVGVFLAAAEVAL
jgi:hypothetical protein